MNKGNILIVDDAYDMLEVLQRQLKTMHYATYQAANVRDAMDVLNHSSVDLLITDLRMPELDGIHLVRYAAQKFPDLPVLVITGFPSVSGAVDAMKSGAVEYLVKPFTFAELKAAVEQSLQKHYGTTAPAEIAPPTGSDFQRIADLGLLAQSEAMQQVLEVILRIRNTRVTTLIQGESGTGKELVARAIHQLSPVQSGPFVDVNCGAIPPHLMETAFFGAVKGAYTGAHQDRKGFFQAAHGGTIFLDEIGNASAAVQMGLLRVIQEKKVYRVGSHQAEDVDVRIVAATNHDLLSLIERGDFRADLFYRLNVINLSLPPLRERPEDIPLLFKHFLQQYAQEFGKELPTVRPALFDRLLAYPWPGNVRELENVAQRALLLGDEQIGEQHLTGLSAVERPEDRSSDQCLPLHVVEYRHILKVLAAVDDNKTRAAEILGITRKTLREKLKRGPGIAKN